MEGLSAAIPAGAVTSIVGPNGCGEIDAGEAGCRPSAPRGGTGGGGWPRYCFLDLARTGASDGRAGRDLPRASHDRGGSGGLRPPSAPGVGRPTWADRSRGRGSRHGAGWRRGLPQSRPAPAFRRRAPASASGPNARPGHRPHRAGRAHHLSGYQRLPRPHGPRARPEPTRGQDRRHGHPRSATWRFATPITSW